MIQSSASCISSNPTEAANLSHSHASGYDPTSSFPSASGSPEAEQQEEPDSSSSSSRRTRVDGLGDTRQEMQVLKEQLEVLRYQVGPHLQQNIDNSSHFRCDDSRADAKSLLPGEDLLKASIIIRWQTPPPSGDSALSQSLCLNKNI